MPTKVTRLTETDQTEKVYRTTIHECQIMIGDKVCRSCGGELTPLETEDNSGNPTYWSGCISCQRFDNGVDENVFKIAKDMVDKHHYISYSYMGVKENYPESEWAEWYRSQYSGTCGTVQLVLRLNGHFNDGVV